MLRYLNILEKVTKVNYRLVWIKGGSKWQCGKTVILLKINLLGDPFSRYGKYLCTLVWAKVDKIDSVSGF